MMLESADTYAGIRSLAALPIEGRRVLVRADLDASDGLAGERLRLALPTLEAARGRGARVVVASSLARPSKSRSELEIEPFAARLAELLGAEVFLPDECVGDAARKVIQELRAGQVCVLENLGSCEEEAGNDRGFAEKLAAFCDVYVNDSLAACNRRAASVDAVPRLVHDRGMGLWLEQELRALDRLGPALERPFFAVVGGPATREAFALLDALLGRAGVIGVGGALGNTLLAASGAELQATPVNAELFAEARAWLRRARDRGVDVRLPTDLVASEGEEGAGLTRRARELPQGNHAIDLGAETVADFEKHARAAKTVLWSGALGSLEHPEGGRSNLALARVLAEITAFRVVLDGPLVAGLLRDEADLVSKIGFVSSGGGASLEYIEGRSLPALETLRGGAT